MTNYPTKSKNNTSNSCCFKGIFKRFICTGNLPTHPSPLDHNNQTIIGKPKINVQNQGNIIIKSQVNLTQTSYSPSIIAKLMGLETFPNNNEKGTTLDSLFRSKSLNSLNFLPDFDPTRASFHRRARTSASFHEQGHNILVKVDENLESNGLFDQESKVGINECRRMRKKSGEKEVVLKAKNRENNGKSRIKMNESKKKYEERYTSGAKKTSSRKNRGLKKSVNNNDINGCNLREREKCAMQKRKLVNNNNNNNNDKEIKVTGKVVSKKKVGYNQVVCIEAHQSDGTLLSRRPVFVLDGHKNVYKGGGGQISSSSRKKSTPRIRNNDNLQQKVVPNLKPNHEENCSKMNREQEVVKAEVMVVDYFVEMLGYISKLAEQHTIRETNWAANCKAFKVHFVEELCLHLGQEILDLLLDELLHDIIIMLL